MMETGVYPSGLMLPSKMPRTSVRFLHRAEKDGGGVGLKVGGVGSRAENEQLKSQTAVKTPPRTPLNPPLFRRNWSDSLSK